MYMFKELWIWKRFLNITQLTYLYLSSLFRRMTPLFLRIYLSPSVQCLPHYNVLLIHSDFSVKDFSKWSFSFYFYHTHRLVILVICIAFVKLKVTSTLVLERTENQKQYGIHTHRIGQFLFLENICLNFLSPF